MKKPPKCDAIRAYQRQAIAARRFGVNGQCACGESRPEALITGSKPLTCAECDRKRKGRTTMDDHHFGSASNHPLTVPVPVNDHRGRLSVDQQDWPKQTRENPDGSPLLAAAGCIRGFVDWVIYVIERGLLWVAEMLETLDAYLTDKLGQRYWVDTPLARFAPRG